jgi:hypothetical protein
MVGEPVEPRLDNQALYQAHRYGHSASTTAGAAASRINSA